MIETGYQAIAAWSKMGYHLWRIDLTNRSHASERSRPQSASAREAIAEFSAPPGFPADGLLSALPARRVSARDGVEQMTSRAQREAADAARRATLYRDYRSSWSAAFSPLRTLFTSALMLFLSGADVHVFSVMAVVTVFALHVQALFATRATFQKLVQQNSDLKGLVSPQAFVHFLLCVIGICGALYKCQLLGFLPTEESDWIGLLPKQRFNQGPLGGMVMKRYSNLS